MTTNFPSFNQRDYIREYNRTHYVRVSLDIKPELRDKWKTEALKRDEWTAGDSFNPYPCKLKVAYDEQLQEEVDGFLHQDESFSYSASMPCI